MHRMGRKLDWAARAPAQQSRDTPSTPMHTNAKTLDAPRSPSTLFLNRKVHTRGRAERELSARVLGEVLLRTQKLHPMVPHFAFETGVPSTHSQPVRLGPLGFSKPMKNEVPAAMIRAWLSKVPEVLDGVDV
jgi:hypothetical protein